MAEREPGRPPERAPSPRRDPFVEPLFGLPARVLARPLEAYAELGPAARSASQASLTRLALRTVGVTLLVLGGFVSLTTAGRLVAFHVVSTMLFWSFAPLVSLVALAITCRLFARGEPLVRAYALFSLGYAPMLLFVLALTGVCLFARDVYGAFVWLLGAGVLPALLLAAYGWGVAASYGFFSRALRLRRTRALAATAVYHLSFALLVTSYYLVTEQLQPQLWGAP
jgi:hypothetical protein